MGRKLITLFGTIAILVLFATPAFAKEITIQGRLQRTVEAGGWVISSSTQKYLILNAQRFQNEKWFAAGNEVEAVGETKPDVVTTQMEGIPFEARTMRPIRAKRFRRKSRRVKRSHRTADRGRRPVEP